jgi:transcription initiation factor TFIID subunit 4
MDEPPTSELAAMVSHATQERLRDLLEKLAVISEHRQDMLKVGFYQSFNQVKILNSVFACFQLESKYESTQDVRTQLRFLEDLDRMERRRHDEQERELLLRAAKSRSKTEDPEQAKLKAKAKEVCLESTFLGLPLLMTNILCLVDAKGRDGGAEATRGKFNRSYRHRP